MSTRDEVLDFAISEEAKAAEFYRELAEKAKRPGIRDLLLSFSKEEEGHKTKLERVKEPEFSGAKAENVVDLKLTDYMVDVEPKTDISYQDALILAAKKEKAAFRLYTKLSDLAQDTELKQLFAALAQEEAKHKLRFEVEYDDFILEEN